MKIILAVRGKFGEPDRHLEWEGEPTIIPGLFLTHPISWYEEKPTEEWTIVHSTGWPIGFQPIKSLVKAKKFIDELAKSNLKWDFTELDYINNSNRLEYMEAVQKAMASVE